MPVTSEDAETSNVCPELVKIVDGGFQLVYKEMNTMIDTIQLIQSQNQGFLEKNEVDQLFLDVKEAIRLKQQAIKYWNMRPSCYKLSTIEEMTKLSIQYGIKASKRMKKLLECIQTNKTINNVNYSNDANIRLQKIITCINAIPINVCQDD